MTARLTLSYLRPTPLGVERRTTIVDGRILNDGGELTVEVTGELSLPLHRQRHAHRDAGPAGGRPT